MICRTLTVALFWRFFSFALLPMLVIGLLSLLIMAGYSSDRDHEQAKILAALAGERCAQAWPDGVVPQEDLARLVKWGGEQAQLFIFDRQGEVLFATISGTLSQPMREDQQLAAAGNGQESVYHFNWRGVSYIGSAVVVSGSGWLALAAYPVTGLVEMFRTFSELILVGLLATLIVAFSGAVFFAQRLTKPLNQLGEGAKAIARGDYTRQFPDHLYHEQEVLAATLRDMAAVIEERERQLLASQQLAEQASKAKNQFLANMSHEIRTPMNGVMGMVDLVLGTQLNAEQRECLQLARTSADSLLRLINDLLDFSSIEAGHMTFDERPFAPQETIDRLISLFAPAATQKGISLASFVDPGMPTHLMGDIGRIEQVLVNLLGNALKFTNQGTISVRVAAHPAADGAKVLVRFSVTDTGIGVASADIERIFKGFTQLDDSYTRKYQGAGLGLTISRQIVEKMGGSMEVTSRPGAGSTFSFIMPLTVIDPLPRQASEQQGIVLRTQPEAASQKRVLLAEDNLVSRRLVEKLLGKKGWNVISAADGLEVLRHCEEADFNLILMDVQMPNMDGLQATMAIRKKEKPAGRRTPIIALTAHAMAEDRERCLLAGMDDYLVKPLRADDLYRTCDRYLCA
jgi:signal transduction histidine kinase